MKSKTAQKILEETSQETKDKAREWAEKVLEESNIKAEMDKQTKELLLLGSLMFKDNQDGSLTWIPRLNEK